MENFNKQASNGDNKNLKTPVFNFKVVGRYAGVLYAGFLAAKTKGEESSTGGLVVVERPWIDVIPNLTPVFDRRKFGT